MALAGMKKGAKAPLFNDLQTSVEVCRSLSGAGNETRTRDPDLGKVVLYQLSYSRLGVLVLAYLAILFKFWSGKRDSNSRPRPWQGRALPTELFPQICTAFVAVVTCNSLSLREAHYTRNPFSCNPPQSDFFEIQFKCLFNRQAEQFSDKNPATQGAGSQNQSLIKFSR